MFQLYFQIFTFFYFNRHAKHREMYRNVTPRPISNIENFKMVLGGISSPVSFSAYQNQCAEEWKHVKETPIQLSKK